MPLAEKAEIENPHIPENYYIATLDDISSYPREDAQSLGLILRFDVQHDGEHHEIPYFAPAKLSVSEDAQSSRLAEDLRRVGLLEGILDSLDVRDEVMSEKYKWIARDETEAEQLISSLFATFENRKVRIDVEDSQDGESSQVGKFSKVFEEGESE